MVNAVAIDVGYGFVKAVASDGRRVYFPSFVAPSSPDPLAGTLDNGRGHTVRIRPGESGKREEKLVGEAAQESGLGSAFLGKDKPVDMHDLFLLAAAYLVGAGGVGLMPGHVDVAVGLPLGYFTNQYKQFQAHLSSIAAWVSVDGGEERYIRFGKTLVIPQGAGAVFTLSDLPSAGFVGVVDVGQYTTDYLVISLDGTARALREYAGSIEIGCHSVIKMLAREFQRLTGAPLPQRMEQYILNTVRNGQAVAYSGRKIFLGNALDAAIKDTAQSIARQVISNWGDLSNYMSTVYLVGGGTLLLGNSLKQAFPAAQTVPNPVFANVNGYLKILAGKR